MPIPEHVALFMAVAARLVVVVVLMLSDHRQLH
jgi:hypothetical protein